jgi:hypothetical protein
MEFRSLPTCELHVPTLGRFHYNVFQPSSAHSQLEEPSIAKVGQWHMTLIFDRQITIRKLIGNGSPTSRRIGAHHSLPVRGATETLNGS